MVWNYDGIWAKEFVRREQIMFIYKLTKHDQRGSIEAETNII